MRKRPLVRAGQWLAALALTAAVLQAAPAAADDPAAELRRLQEKQAEIQNSRKNAESALQGVYLQTEETKVRQQLVQNELVLATARVATVGAQLKATHAELERVRAELAETEAHHDLQKSRLGGRLRAIREQGRVSYFAVLRGANSFSDFIGRIDMLKEIVKHDSKVLREIRTAADELTLKRDAVSTQEAQLVSLQAQEQSHKTTVEAKDAELKVLAAELKRQQADLLARIAEYEKETERVEQEIYEAQLRLARAAGKFAPTPPLKGRLEITSWFGPRIHPVYGGQSNHGGVDFAAKTGDPVLAIEAGVVIYTGYDNIYGYRVVIDHGGGIASWYGHNSRILVSTGENVAQGQVIARAGSTGLSTGPHVHLEIRINNERQDPLEYLKL